MACTDLRLRVIDLSSLLHVRSREYEKTYPYDGDHVCAAAR